MKYIITAIALIFSITAFGQVVSSTEVPLPVSQEDKNKPIDFLIVYENPDVMPDFPEGISAFRTQFQNAVDTNAFHPENGENDLKALISFIIERDGSMTDVKVSGSNEKFNTEVKKAVRSIKDKWKPGKIKGQAVRSRYKIPLTIKIS